MSFTRRDVVKSLGTAAGMSAAALPWSRTLAAQAPRLDVKDPAAVSLGYVENAAEVDARKFPEYSPGSICENCLQLRGIAGDNYRPCSVFPGKLVSVSGWCKGWTPEM
jgi:hypothetical protein